MSLFLAAVHDPQSGIASGSPLWQIVFLSFAAGLILFEIIRGWRLGLMRQLVRAGAIVAAYAAGIFGGRLLLPLMRPFLKMPDIVISIGAGATLALIVYFAVVTIGSILFKRTTQQEAGAIRWLYGICGAIAGVFFGLFTLWLIVIGIRSLGAVANAQLQTRTAQRPSPASGLRASSTEAYPRSGSASALPLVNSLARLKNSIELGPVGNAVKSADLVPDGAYETLGKVGQIVSNPESAERFLSYPGAKKLTGNPRIAALRDDPEIMQMIQEGRFLDLLKDRRIIEAMNDPALAAQVRGFQFQKALDYAVERN